MNCALRSWALDRICAIRRDGRSCAPFCPRGCTTSSPRHEVQSCGARACRLIDSYLASRRRAYALSCLRRGDRKPWPGTMLKSSPPPSKLRFSGSLVHDVIGARSAPMPCAISGWCRRQAAGAPEAAQGIRLQPISPGSEERSLSGTGTTTRIHLPPENRASGTPIEPEIMSDRSTMHSPVHTIDWLEVE